MYALFVAVFLGLSLLLYGTASVMAAAFQPLFLGVFVGIVTVVGASVGSLVGHALRTLVSEVGNDGAETG
jgi:uncharacterized membrane-anchored protein YitT (DUF2179 family)